MKGTIDRYLDKVMAVAAIDDTEKEASIREELRDHLEMKVEALKSEGYDHAEALVKAVEDHGSPVIVGYRLRPWRFVDIRVRGTARGVIAIGPKARGVLAIGGVAFGVFAFGGVAIGAFSFGGLALGALLAWGGCTIGGVAYGGLAVGIIAFGGMGVGIIASGGTAAGIWVPGAGQALWSYFTWQTAPTWWHGIGEWLSFNPNSPQEVAAFQSMLGTLMSLTMIIAAVVFTSQGILMKRETKRVAGIEPSVFE